MILGLHHLGVAVPDMQAALDFYCGVLGFTVVMEAELPAGWRPMARALGLADPASTIRMVRKGNSCIEFFEPSEWISAKSGEEIKTSKHRIER